MGNDEVISISDPSEECEPFDGDGDDEEEEDLEIGVEPGEGEEDRAPEEGIGHRPAGGKERNGSGEAPTEEDEEVIADVPPVGFQGSPHEVEEIPCEQEEERMGARREEEKCDETPDFALSDEGGIEHHIGQ